MSGEFPVGVAASAFFNNSDTIQSHSHHRFGGRSRNPPGKVHKSFARIQTTLDDRQIHTQARRNLRTQLRGNRMITRAGINRRYRNRFRQNLSSAGKDSTARSRQANLLGVLISRARGQTFAIDDRELSNPPREKAEGEENPDRNNCDSLAAFRVGAMGNHGRITT